MTYEGMEEDIKCFITDELQDFKDYPDCFLEEDIKNNTLFLNSLSDNDIKKISYNIFEDEELYTKVRETIRWYVYHYKKEVK